MKKVLLGLGTVLFGANSIARISSSDKHTNRIQSRLYRAINGKPDENMAKVIELTGGIEKIVDSNDVVLIKPNVQWWNQGTPNLSALKTFIGLIMNRPNGFSGEVIIAENCHRGPDPWNSLASGWTRRFSLNADLLEVHNFNDLSRSLKRQYGDQFTTCHWIDVDEGSKRVYGPEDGEGYVYCDGTGGVPLISYDNGCKGEHSRSVIMTYPIMKTDRGTVIDFKNGIWENGSYTGQPLKFVNFAALNHHSTFCGATSAIKNYLGVTDLSGGSDPRNGGKLTEEYHNFHSFAFDWTKPGPAPGMIGAEVRVFMNTIRRADLNITTAEWVGLASRTEPPVAHTRTILASTDPVALDYHATKYLLYPNSMVPIHNPDNEKSPLHQYLRKCAEEDGGVFDERYVDVKSYDFEKKRVQGDGELLVRGERGWGRNLKMILKYLLLRYWI